MEELDKLSEELKPKEDDESTKLSLLQEEINKLKEKQESKKSMTHKQEDGTVLYGFSQTNMDEYNRKLKDNTENVRVLITKIDDNTKQVIAQNNTLINQNQRLTRHSNILLFGIIIGALIGVGLLGYISWITYYIIKHNVINNIVANCI